MVSVFKPEQPYNPAVRRKMIRLLWFGGALMLALVGCMFASFSGWLPEWVSGTSMAATGVASCILTDRSEALRKRLRD